MTRTKVPAVEGLFTTGADPQLIGGRGSSGSYYFPKDMGGADPAAYANPEREEVLLSRTGTVWSYTTSNYPPPLPYQVTTEPYEPIVIAAVQLDQEKLVICGQMVPGIGVEDLEVGMAVEVTVDTLYSDDDHDYLVWKWQPATGRATTNEGDPS